MRNIAQLVAFGCLTDSPAAFPKVHSSVKVRVSSIPAGATRENRLRRTVQLFSMPTLRAFTTGIARVHENQLDSSSDALVRNELLQLVERPGVQDGTLREPSLDLFPDAIEFFEHHGAIRAFGFRNNLLGNAVIQIFGKARLSAGQFFEKTLAVSRSLLLQLRSQMKVTIANPFHFRAAETLAVRVGKNLRHAKIATKKTIGRLRIGNLIAEHKIYVQFLGMTVKAKDSGSRFLSFQKTALVVPDRQLDFDATPDSRKTYRFRLLDEAKKVFVKVCAGWLEIRRSLLPLAETSGYAGNGANRIVGSQFVFGFDAVIAEFMQSELSTNILFVGNCKDIIAGSSESFKRENQRLSLFSCWLELASHCLYGFHKFSLPLNRSNFKKGVCDFSAA